MHLVMAFRTSSRNPSRLCIPSAGEDVLKGIARYMCSMFFPHVQDQLPHVFQLFYHISAADSDQFAFRLQQHGGLDPSARFLRFRRSMTKTLPAMFHERMSAQQVAHLTV